MPGVSDEIFVRSTGFVFQELEIHLVTAFSNLSQMEVKDLMKCLSLRVLNAALRMVLE